MSRILGAAAVLAAVLSCASAGAVEITRLGVMSAFGDRVNLVVEEMQTGSRVNRNQRHVVKAPPEDYQNFAVGVAAKAVRAARPGAAVIELALGQDQEPPWQTEAERLVPEEGLKAAIDKGRLSHLLLIQPARAPAALKTQYTAVGVGTLEGLGFYVDTHTETVIAGTEEHARGYLAPYAYFRVLLVDGASLAILCERKVLASSSFSAARADGDSHPWRALTPEQKTQALRELIQTELKPVVGDCVQKVQ